MTLEEIKNDCVGAWTGENMLRLSWMNPPQSHSLSNLEVTTAVKDKFLTLNYTWEHENIPQEGLLLLGFDPEKEIVSAAWTDSWHSGVKPLILSGAIDEKGTIDLRGVYEVPNHPDWGWRIVISTSEHNLRIVMYNVTPEGEEDLAVQSDYKRIK